MKKVADPAAIDMAALEILENAELLRLRAMVAAELKRRGLASNVGEVAEALAVAFFNGTAGRPNLLLAPTNTQNVDALSRKGERYSIKGVQKRKRLARFTLTVMRKTNSYSNFFSSYRLTTCGD